MSIKDVEEKSGLFYHGNNEYNSIPPQFSHGSEDKTVRFDDKDLQIEIQKSDIAFYQQKLKEAKSINSELSHETLKLKEEIKMKELQEQVLHGIIEKLINALASNSKCN